MKEIRSVSQIYRSFSFCLPLASVAVMLIIAYYLPSDLRELCPLASCGAGIEAVSPLCFHSEEGYIVPSDLVESL